MPRRLELLRFELLLWPSILLCAALALAGAGAARAADIAATAQPDGSAMVTLAGRIEPDDAAKFRSATLGVSHAVIVLNSDGGSAYDGIEIGRTIRQRGYATAILEGTRCASACALAWLGGTPRYIGATASVGFHAAYTLQAGRASTSSAGNALVGAYLHELGLSDRAIVYLTRERPSRMGWLTRNQAERYGIDTVSLPPGPLPPELRAGLAPAAGPLRRPVPPPVQPAASAPPRLRPEGRRFLPPEGQRYRDSLALRGRRIPLPPGEWAEIGRYAWSGPGFRYEDLALVRLRETGVTALVIVRTSDSEGGYFVGAWGNSPICSRTDGYAAAARRHGAAVQECALLTHAVHADETSTSEVWRTYLALRANDGDHYPTTFIAAAYRFARDARATTLTYYFGVEEHGFPAAAGSWATSPWHPAQLSPERAALVTRYRYWLEENFDSVQQGVQGNRPTALTSPP
ncbi:COG3904 family protein [Siccirubricoccus phaeus]|uniref:COG3904 family protein n=1 Tax=Siccirubricoccus phaeus TaxID=2595053 RepID=UPI0011F3E39D|nr:hypothetical protein [Siccirubricoccus phaeus]